MAVTLDTLELKIQSNSAGASSGIRSLIDSLSSLRGTTDESLQSLQKLADTLGSISSSLKNIKFSQSLQTAIKNTPLAEIKNQADDASRALKITGNNIDEFKAKELPAEWFTEKTGKDWTQENAEDTRYFDAWLSRIVNDQEKYEKIRDTVKGMHVYDSAAQADEVANAKPVLGEVEKISETIENMPTIEEALQFSDEASKAEMLQMKLESVQEQLANALGQDNFDSKKIATYSLQIKTLQEQLAKLERIEREQGNAPSARSAVSYATELSQYETMRLKLDGIGQKLATELGKDTPDQSKIAGYVSQIQTLEEKMRGLAEAESEVNANKPEVSGFGKLMSQIGRMAKTMAIRSALRGTIKALKEGITNLYNWSDSVNGSFADSMDSAAAHFTLMKNSIATVAGPILQSLIPAFNTLASVINTVCNLLAQFFALIGGQTTWTKATLGADKFGKAASGAGGAAKDLLADWDELNIIQSQGGGGGGSGSSGFGGMFEEMPMPTWMTQWKPLIDAVLAGTLGGILLPKIFDIIKKIMDLFGGTGALNAIDILKRMVKLPSNDFTGVTNDLDKLIDTFNKPLTDTGIDNLLKDLGDDSLDDILKNLSPLTDLFKDNNFLDTINGILGLAHDLGDKFDWTTILPSVVDLLGKLFDGDEKSVDVKVNDEAYKLFKAALAADILSKEVTIKVDDKELDTLNQKVSDILSNIGNNNGEIIVGAKIDPSEERKFKDALNRIDMDVAKDRDIVIGIKFDGLDDTQQTLDSWASEISTKQVVVEVDDWDLFKSISDIASWCGSKETKSVSVAIDSMGALDVMREIDEWCENDLTKSVSVIVDDTNISSAIDRFESIGKEPINKSVTITIDDSDILDLIRQLDDWCSAPLEKKLIISPIVDNKVQPTAQNTNYVLEEIEEVVENNPVEKSLFDKAFDAAKNTADMVWRGAGNAWEGAKNTWEKIFGTGTKPNITYDAPIGPPVAPVSPSVQSTSTTTDVTSVLLPQILDAVYRVATNVDKVGSIVESKDTNPTVIVNQTTGTAFKMGVNKAGRAFNAVTGDTYP